jgi:hypothetical protein
MKNTQPLTVSAETPAFQSWFAGVVKIHDDYMTRNFPNNPKNAITFTTGNRFMKVLRGHSVHAFVDRVNGDVLKPASWNAPAKGARGNIFAVDNGLTNIGEYGPKYSRDMKPVPVPTPKTQVVNGVETVIPEGSHVVQNLLSGRDVVQAVNTPLCCDVSRETYHSM